MKIGCGEWGFRELPLEEHFAIARRLGFRYLEFGIGGGLPGRLPDVMTEADARRWRRWADAYELLTPYCCLENDFTLADPAAHRALLARVLEQLPWAAACGATHVRLFAGFTPADEMTPAIWERMLDAFSQCEQLCRQLNLSIAIETHGKIEHRQGVAHHQHTVTTRRAELERLLAALPSSIGFNYDPGNLKPLADDDAQLRLDLLQGRICYCHLKDWRRVGTGWEACAPGDDDLDYAALLPQIDFDGVYLIEYEPVAKVEAGIRRSLAYLQRIAPAAAMA